MNNEQASTFLLLYEHVLARLRFLESNSRGGFAFEVDDDTLERIRQQTVTEEDKGSSFSFPEWKTHKRFECPTTTAPKAMLESMDYEYKPLRGEPESMVDEDESAYI
ncbi:unnamed protein product [Amoebophrya sp. A25]|nr:unnamed protein product [Amoebophrya sp. A25]|eukprot:GSA25T00021745001.1